MANEKRKPGESDLNLNGMHEHVVYANDALIASFPSQQQRARFVSAQIALRPNVRYESSSLADLRKRLAA